MKMLLKHCTETILLHDAINDDAAAGHQGAASPSGLTGFRQYGVREIDQENFIRDHGLGFINALSDEYAPGYRMLLLRVVAAFQNVVDVCSAPGALSADFSLELRDLNLEIQVHWIFLKRKSVNFQKSGNSTP